ncbi:MAG: hypothetical protein GC206_11420 [Alphaproteobacteria bacterium]|nr:hypothetical protein [Alphaproteobacteria bacterium]
MLVTDTDPAEPDAWAQGLPGLDLMHDLRCQAADFSAIAGIVGAAAAAGAAIDAVRADRSAEGVQMRCRMLGISAPAARALAETLEREGWTAGRAQIEHMMIARRSSVR